MGEDIISSLQKKRGDMPYIKMVAATDAKDEAIQAVLIEFQKSWSLSEQRREPEKKQSQLRSEGRKLFEILNRALGITTMRELHRLLDRHVIKGKPFKRTRKK